MTNTMLRPTRLTRPRVLPPAITGQEVILLAVIAILWAMLGATTEAFLSAGSIQPLLVAVAPTAVIGVGMTFVILTGGIDVSVGASMMVCSVLTAKGLADAGLPPIAAVGMSVVAGAVLGLINGVLIAYGRIHAIIITFGTANLFQFLGLRIFDSSTVDGIPNTLAFLGKGEAGRSLGIPHSFAITVVLVVLAWWYLRYAKGGRHLYAIGGNENAARLAGVRVRRHVTAAYAVTGALVGLGSCFVIASGTSTLDQSVGAGTELTVIAAVVLGGTSILGGRGSVVGTLLGAILVRTVLSGTTQLGLPSELGFLFVGLFIIIAVGIDLLRNSRGKK